MGGGGDAGEWRAAWMAVLLQLEEERNGGHECM